MELISVNQDPLRKSVQRIMKNEYREYQVWVGPLVHNQTILLILNTRDSKQDISISLDEIGLNSSISYHMKDLWTDKQWIIDGSNSTNYIRNRVASHATWTVKIRQHI